MCDGFYFVFLWVCNNGNLPTGIPSPVVHGPAFCWTKQWDLGLDGYSDPDGGGYCFISFDGGSPRLSETMEGSSPSHLYYDWLVNFYSFALSSSPRYSIYDALDLASLYSGFSTHDTGITNYYQYATIRTGYATYWPGGGGQPAGWIYNNHMKVYGDGAVCMLP